MAKTRNNFTPVPNELFDIAMPSLTPIQWKIYSCIVRKTIGWQKDKDKISFNQIAKISGVSRRACLENVPEMVTGKWITYTTTKRGKLPINEYQINLDHPQLVRQRHQYAKRTSAPDAPVASAPNAPVTGQTSAPDAPTKDSIKENIKEYTLPNKMTPNELLCLLKQKPKGVIEHKDEHKEIIRYLSKCPREDIEWAVKLALKENTPALWWLDTVYKYADQREYWEKKKRDDSMSNDDRERDYELKQMEHYWNQYQDGTLKKYDVPDAMVLSQLKAYRKLFDKYDTAPEYLGVSIEKWDEAIANFESEGSSAIS